MHRLAAVAGETVLRAIFQTHPSFHQEHDDERTYDIVQLINGLVDIPIGDRTIC